MSQSAEATPIARIHGEPVLVGTRVLLEEWGVRTDGHEAAAREMEEVAMTPLWVARGGAVAGMIGVQTGDGVTPTPGTTLGGFAGLLVCSANLPDKIAIAVDVQVDDGVGTAGTVRADLQTSANQTINTASAADAYAETGTNQYVLCRAM